MKKKLNSFFFCFLFFFSLSAQNTAFIDSLKNVLANTSIAEDKIPILNDLAFALRYIDSDLAFKHAELAFKLASNSIPPNKKAMASSQIVLGILAKKLGNYSKSEEHYLAALELRKAIDDHSGVGSVYNNLGNLAKEQVNFQKAIQYFDLGLRALEGKETQKLLLILRTNLAAVYRHLGQYQEAIQELDHNAHFFKNLKDTSRLASTLLTLGNVHLELYNSKKALEYFEESLSLFKKIGAKNGEAKCYINIGAVGNFSGNYELALSNFTTALQLKKHLSEAEISLIYRNIGSSYFSLNRDAKAIKSFQSSLSSNLELGNFSEIASNNFNLGKVFYKQGDYPKALVHFQECLSSLDSFPDMFLKTQVLHKLSETFAQLDRFDDAFETSKKCTELQDSLNVHHLEATHFSHKLEENQKKIELLEKEKTIQVVEGQKQNIIIQSLIGLLVFGLILGAVGFRAYRSNQKQKLAEKDVELSKRRIIELLNEKEMQATFARLEGQDSERKRISQDLHDRMGSMLSTVKLYFKGISKFVERNEDGKERYHKASALLDDACVEIRKVAHNLESGILTEFGLTEELHSLANTIRDSQQLFVNVTTHGFKDRLDSILEIKVYRIIQELVNNTIKHANANNLNIHLNRFKEVLNILIEDDGNGFELKAAKEKKGMGLKNVESRLHDLNGSLIIDSDSGNGTTISIDIPLN